LAETPRENKESALRRHHALNLRPQAVGASAFTSDNAFFDARDLVQVKYEMLRQVREDGQLVSQAAAEFGFSRPSFYQAQTVFDAEGLPGLVPQRPGPKRAHKLSEEVVDRLDEALDRGTESVLDDLNVLTRANMEDQIERFSTALADGHILPEDF
jgi:hypothetical protein